VRRASGERSFTGDPGRFVKRGSGYGHLSPWGPVGEPGGDSLAGTSERKGMYILVPFLDTEDIKILRLGPSGTFAKGQGFPEPISDYGAHRAHL